MEQSKMQYIRNIQDLATQIAGIKHKCEDLQAIWDSRLYGPGAANQFSDTELALLDTMGLRSCAADDLYSFVIFCKEFQTFLANGVPAQRDYNANLNHLRTDL